MKQLITLIGLFFLLTSTPAFGQCDEFAQAILSIVKTESYSDFKKYFEPKEAKRTRMLWPQDTAATNYLNRLEANLYQDLVTSAQGFREMWKKQGIDLSSASYVSCERTSGIKSAIKINFKILTRNESFIIQTFEGDQTYITSALMNGKHGFTTPITSFTIINNQKYTTFKPRKDELAKGLTHLKRFLSAQSITDYNYHCTLGLNSLFGGTFLEFLVMVEERNMYVLVDLNSGKCEEVFK